MIKSKRQFLILALCGLVLTAFFCCGNSNQSDTEKLYFARQTNGRIYSFHEVTLSRSSEGGRDVVRLVEDVRSMISVLGASIDSQSRSEYLIDARNEQWTSFESTIDSGTLRLHIAAVVEDGTARITLEPGGGEKTVSLSEDILLENPYFYPHLVKYFGEDGPDSWTYKFLDTFDRKVYEVTCSRAGNERITLEGETYQAIVLDSLVHEIGLKMKIWIDAESGYFLKGEHPQGVMFRTERSTRDKLERVNLDERILARTGVMIGDIRAISYLKARMVLEPIGNRITAESLNLTGQSFEGTVEDNLIRGTFEIRHKKYDGRLAPLFPPGFGGDEKLKPFLLPEDFIESDDSVLIRKAMDLTAGAADCWEASKRLAGWVAENIGYDIPGGASARNTYDLQAGECGAHSRLFAAFCRAAGIPARVVWGCMYVPNNGGCFGQHAWNEVYMGEAGWIPLDTTAREIDFVDSGHVRLGVLSSSHIAFNPQRMEILDYRAGGQESGREGDEVDDGRYLPYIGKYRGPQKVFTVFVRNKGLAVDIPGRMVVELRDPDENEVWFLKLTKDVDVMFPKDESGRVTGLILRNRVRIPKKLEDREESLAAPEELRAYLGRYPVPMDGLQITVLAVDGKLRVRYDSQRGEETHELLGPDADGWWSIPSGQDSFMFVRDDSGQVRAMILLETVRCRRID